MEITKTFKMDTAHRLPDHEGKCWNIHGHTYHIDITLEGDDGMDMLMDFSDVKSIVNRNVIDIFDHSLMIYKDDPLRGEFALFIENVFKETGNKMNIIFVDYIPTAENMAKDFYYRLEDYFFWRDVYIKSVRVWETPTSYATYYENN